jgi:hypothetical protein
MYSKQNPLSAHKINVLGMNIIEELKLPESFSILHAFSIFSQHTKKA